MVAFNVYTKKSFRFKIFIFLQTQLIPPSLHTVSMQQQHQSTGGGRVFYGNRCGNRSGSRGRGNRGGRSGRSFKQSGETDLYDMTIAPLNIYDN